MIKAYHQVGTDSMEPAERSELLARVIKIGSLLPATQRVRRAEMEDECFGDSESAVPLHLRFEMANETTLAALRQMAREWVRQLPENGTSHTMFTCADILAGDMDRIFMSIGNWYGVDTGFVFDAEELIGKGAAFRPQDMLGPLDYHLENISKRKFDSILQARASIESVIEGVLFEYSHHGRQALSELRKCQAKSGKKYKEWGCTKAEIVWDGPLPLGLSIEAWDNGTQIS